jgi:hypothetical protein
MKERTIICCKRSPLPNDCCDGVGRVGYPSSRFLRDFRYLPKGHLLDRIRRRDVACSVSAAAGKIQRLFSTFPFPCNPHKSGSPYFCYRETPLLSEYVACNQ